MTKHLHGLSLLLLMLVIALALLVTLSLVTANSDLKIAQRQADFMSGTQNNINSAQNWIGEIAQGKDPGADQAEDGQIFKEFDDGYGRHLSVKLVREESGIRITEWTAYTAWDALDEPLYNPNK